MNNQPTNLSTNSCLPLALARAARRGCRLTWLLLLWAVGAAVFPAAGVIRDGGVDPANLGKGEWIFSLADATNKLSGHVSSVTNENSLMLYFKSQGIRWVIIKAATGANLYNGCYPGPQFSSSLVTNAHNNGLFIFGDTRSFGTNIVGEIGVADFCFTNGADGFVWDAEQEWEPSGHPGITNGPLQAWWLCGTTRTNWPNKFLAHSPQAIIAVHTTFAYKEFGYWCDAVMPMVYHFNPTYSPGFTNSVSQAMEYTDANWTYYQNQWSNMSSVINGQTFYFSNSIKPIIPMQDVYGSGSSTICEGTASAQATKDVMEFIDYAAADPNAATAGGYQSVDFFRCDLHDATQWGYIRAGTSGNLPGIVNNVVLDDKVALKSGSWTKVLTFYPATPTPNKINFSGCGSLSDTNSFGTNYWTKAKGTGSAYMQFTPNILVPGDYTVYQWHPNVTNASASVPHIITYNGGTTTVNANQTTNAGKWSLLGRFNFAAGTAGTVQVTDGIPEANALAIVDGLKLVFTASNTVSISLNVAPNPAVYGDAVTLTASLTSSLGTPNGTVTFKDGTTTLGTATLNGSGQATFTTNRLSVAGSPHSLTVVYGGNGSYNSCVSSACSQTITPKALTLTGLTAPDKAYDGTTNAPLAGTPALAGVVGSDAVSLTGTATGAFPDKSVGTNLLVTVTGLSLSGAAAGNYTLTPLTLSADITPAMLTVGGLTANSKFYDSTADATLTGSPALLGVVGNEDVVLLGAATATFTNKTVGLSQPVMVTGFSLNGADVNNYALAPLTLSADILPVPLAVSGLAAENKVYDANTNATVTGSPVLSSGIVGSESVMLTGTATGGFTNKTVGSHKPVLVTGLVLSGADAGNYGLTPLVLSADITAVTLALSGITAADKVYDGTTNAPLAGAPALLGAVGSDTVLVSGTASGAFTNKLVGTNLPVTVTGLSLSGEDAPNYSLAPLTLSADITAAPLTVGGLTAKSKFYDGTADATLTGTPALLGVVSNEDVVLLGTATATFTNKTVGPSQPVIVTGFSLSGADVNNYTLAPLTLSADITAAPLTVSGITAESKTYDGTTNALLHLTNVTLVTVVSGDDVTLEVAEATGAFTDPEVGCDKLVNISGLSLTGADVGNYVLTQPVTTTADIRPTTLPSVVSLGYEASSGTFRMKFAGYPNFHYRIETASSPNGPWSLLQTVSAGSDGTIEVMDTRSPGEQARFYRTLYP